MYTAYFGLRENPFSIAPDPRYLYMSARHREALAHLQYGVQSDGAFVLLTGEVGAGKTTLCRQLISQLPDDVDVAFVLNPNVTVIELLETICDELQLPYLPAASNKQLVDLLNSRLLENHARGRKTVLIIDEAQNLGVDVLEQLRLLTNLETEQRKLLQIVLLGQPELRSLLARPVLRQMAQRITARYHLDSLDSGEVLSYIRHRLEVAGCTRQLFPESLERRLFKLTDGVPRLINLLCDRALLGAYTLERTQVDAQLLRQAAAEVFDRPFTQKPLVPVLNTVATLLLIAAAGLGLWAWLVSGTPLPGVAGQSVAVEQPVVVGEASQ